MARSKQTAHKSTGGRKRYAVKSARSASVLRSTLTSHQQVGTVSRAHGTEVQEKTSFLNHENVLGSFHYPWSRTDAMFEPKFSIGVAPHSNTGLPEIWTSVQFSSKLDGPGLEKRGRPPLNLVLVLDISGSMGGVLLGDYGIGRAQSKSKLDVVKECVYSILEQLNENDLVGITLFNHDVYELIHATRVTQNSRRKIRKMLEAIKPGGGTNLSKGFNAGMSDLEKCSSSESCTLHRVMFLTDMESSQNDENRVLMEAASRSKNNLHTTVVGIGVDLSVGTVESLSKIPGGKYISVSSSDEFQNIACMDFAHDVWPIAFDIHILLENGFSVDRICGSAELNSVVRGEKEFKISSEFSAPLNGQNEMQGGIFLVKLQSPESASQTLRLKASWKTMLGITESIEVSLDVPKPGSEIPKALRKALAIIRFVDLQSAFCNSEGEQNVESRMERLSELRQCKKSLLSEMKELKDDTLQGENANFIETLDKIIALEEEETKSLDRRKRLKTDGNRPSTRSMNQTASSNMNAAFLCPIGKEVMKDPVCTADGHTFERRAIEKWLRTNNKSPLTGLKLENKILTPNLTIRSLIRELA